MPRRLPFGGLAQLLIVEDDLATRSSLSRALSERGHAVASAGMATTALAMVESSAPDLLSLDLGLPDLNGLQMLRMLRAVSSVPVIVATARDDERTVVAALDAGADDYVIKPFSAMQVDARIRAVLRRVVEDRPRKPLRVGQLCVDAVSRTASWVTDH
jgi:DNA-binding response OmpR family regulator